MRTIRPSPTCAPRPTRTLALPIRLASLPSERRADTQEPQLCNEPCREANGETPPNSNLEESYEDNTTQPILRDQPFYKDNGVPNQLAPPSSEHQVDAQGLHPAVDVFNDNAKNETQTTQDCPSSSALAYKP